MTTSLLPLISIGMPVRNEARFLEEALDSLVKQVGVRTEIIISDNASTDETESISKRFCANYPQIRYQRFEKNVGVSTNFARVLEEAKGEYFIWASGHDLWDHNYLQECSYVLEQNPGARIAFGTTRWIDAEGQPFPRFTGWCDTRGMSTIGRYFAVFWGNMNPIIGLIRTHNLKQQKVDDMVGVDLAVLLSLVIQGDFVHAYKTGWCRREFRKEVHYEQKLERYRSTEYALSSSWLGRHFPLARLPLRIISDLFTSELRLGEKLMIIMILLVSLPIKYMVDKTRKGEAKTKESHQAPNHSA